MPSFSDSIVLFVLALLLFGPKKLPVLAREIGKWVGEFRRASNEFKMQMEEELRTTEQADRQAKIAAMEAAAPVPPALTDGAAEPEPVQPNVTGTSYDFHEGENTYRGRRSPYRSGRRGHTAATHCHLRRSQHHAAGGPVCPSRAKAHRSARCWTPFLS